MRIGFLGTGTMASAMVEAIASDGHAIIVSERSKANSSRLAATYSNVRVADNQAVVEQCEILFLGLLADHAREVLPQLTIPAGLKVVSVMAGMPLAELSGLVPGAEECAIMIPFPFIARGNSPFLVFPATKALEALFAGRNHMIALPDEDKLNHFLAAQAVLSPVLKSLEVTASWLGARTGDAATSEDFLRLLVGGYLISQPPGRAGVLADILDDLNSEGGLNAQFREYVGEQGGYDLIESGLARLEARLSG